MTRQRFALATALALTSVVLLSGCTEGNVSSQLTLEEAKAGAQQLETDIAEQVPTDMVAAVDQQPTGVLVRCDEDNAYQWTGQTIVTLSGNPSGEDLVRDIADAYDEAQYSTDPGYPEAVIATDAGSAIVSFRERSNEISIGTASTCFRSEDVDPTPEY